MENEVVINVRANTTQAQMNLREVGEKVSQLGMRMSAAFTLPVLALGRMVLQNEEVKKSLEPVTAEFAKINDELAQAMLPIIEELKPALLSLAESLREAIRWFNGLSIEQKNVIIGFIGIVAAIGPALVIIGQVINTIGTLQMLLPMLSSGLFTMGGASTAAGGGLFTMAAGAAAAVAPFLLLAAAVASLVLVLTNLDKIAAKGQEWGNAFKNIPGVGGELARGAVLGGPLQAWKNVTGGLPAGTGAIVGGSSAGSGITGTSMLPNYSASPTIVNLNGGNYLGTPEALAAALRPAIEAAQRRSR